MKTLSVDIIVAAALMIATAAVTVDFVLDSSAAPVDRAERATFRLLSGIGAGLFSAANGSEQMQGDAP